MDLRAGGIDGTVVHNRRAWKVAIRQPDPSTGKAKAKVD